MELLERDVALATLAEAHEAAAGGRGRVVLVTGEAGIGKTSLVARFLSDLGRGARVLAGTCDDLLIPRPLGPILHLAGDLSPQLETALAGGAAPHEIQTLLIAELERPPRPTILALEDVHWADDATFDAITLVGRRIGTLPALLVLTLRSGEVPPRHPLRTTLGSLPADHTVVIELAPLSKDAVASLAGHDAAAVFAATGGNPFYVTELLAARVADELPPSIANAVLGRAARLDERARRLVDLVSVVPTRMPTSLLDTVMPAWSAAAEEPERVGLLDVEPTAVRFRHELARHAIRASVPVAVRRELHGRILAALLEEGAEPADIVHHAEEAGAEDVVAEYALVAARRASALASTCEAYSHYLRAADFAHLRRQREQATLFEELAIAAYITGELDEAFTAIERAIEIFERWGEDEAVGRCTRILSRFHWFAGDGAAARTHARRAIAILEPLGESGELARAYSGLSQLGMLSEDPEQAFHWGEKALELATRLGDERTRAHALINIGTARLQLDVDDVDTLLEAHAIADAVGDRHEAARALVNMAYTLLLWVRPDDAKRYGERALAYAAANEEEIFVAYTGMMLAWLRLREGAWREAEDVAERELAQDEPSVAQLLAKTVLAELAVRRGDDDATERLADIQAQADGTAEFQRIAPVLELRTERALTTGAPMPRDAFERVLSVMDASGPSAGWGHMRIAAWAAVAGVDSGLEPPQRQPFAAMAARDWRTAADVYGEAGWRYDRALMLSLLDDEESLLEALDLARSLEAEPLERRATQRLRALGLRVPPRLRRTTLANPAGLTARQQEVLALLVEGLSNAEIAQRLVVSPRTAEHHVSAIMTKLGAASRGEAALRAAELHA